MPTLAAFLSDSNSDTSYLALAGLQNITHEKDCTPPEKWSEPDVALQLQFCRRWWEEKGKVSNLGAGLASMHS